jgi:hypothetical protein
VNPDTAEINRCRENMELRPQEIKAAGVKQIYSNKAKVITDNKSSKNRIQGMLMCWRGNQAKVSLL